MNVQYPEFPRSGGCGSVRRTGSRRWLGGPTEGTTLRKGPGRVCGGPKSSCGWETRSWFHTDQVDAHLQELGVDTLAYAGFAAEMCVLSAEGGARAMLGRTAVF